MDDLELPKPSAVDRLRDVAAAGAELDPTGISGAALAGLDIFWPRALERRRSRFFELVAERLEALGRDMDTLREDVAVGALAQGVLAAARSTSPEHLDYLATATARAMSADERDEARAMVLLRIAGDMSAAHVRLLRMYADPDAYGRAADQSVRWLTDEGGRLRLRSIVETFDPELAGDETLVAALLGDIERFGLTGGNVSTWAEDSAFGSVGDPYKPVIEGLGVELLYFIEPPGNELR